MRGVVAEVRQERVAAISLMAGYSVLEITGNTTLSTGDIVNGDLETVGERTLRNETTGEDVEVAIADFCHSLAHARRVLAGTSSG